MPGTRAVRVLPKKDKKVDSPLAVSSQPSIFLPDRACVRAAAMGCGASAAKPPTPKKYEAAADAEGGNSVAVEAKSRMKRAELKAMREADEKAQKEAKAAADAKEKEIKAEREAKAAAKAEADVSALREDDKPAEVPEPTLEIMQQMKLAINAASSVEELQMLDKAMKAGNYAVIAKAAAAAQQADPSVPTGAAQQQAEDPTVSTEAQAAPGAALRELRKRIDMVAALLFLDQPREP